MEVMAGTQRATFTDLHRYVEGHHQKASSIWTYSQILFMLKFHVISLALFYANSIQHSLFTSTTFYLWLCNLDNGARCTKNYVGFYHYSYISCLNNKLIINTFFGRCRLPSCSTYTGRLLCKVFELFSPFGKIPNIGWPSTSRWSNLEIWKKWNSDFQRWNATIATIKGTFTLKKYMHVLQLYQKKRSWPIKLFAIYVISI